MFQTVAQTCDTLKTIGYYGMDKKNQICTERFLIVAN